jgi:Domain of unknown function (DUF5911)
VSTGARPAPRARYLPIAEHGLIGDLHTVALVGTDGTIDWYCCPRFDSPRVFGAILDADHGGLFRILPDCDGWSSSAPMTSSRASEPFSFVRPDTRRWQQNPICRAFRQSVWATGFGHEPHWSV